MTVRYTRTVVRQIDVAVAHLKWTRLHDAQPLQTQPDVCDPIPVPRLSEVVKRAGATKHPAK